MTLSDENLLELWRLALQTELGIVIPVKQEDAKWLVQGLYRARQNSGDAELEALQIRTPQDKEEIWICKKLTSLSEKLP